MALTMAVLASMSVTAQVREQSDKPQPMNVATYQPNLKQREIPAHHGQRDAVTLLEEDFSLMTAGSLENPDPTNLVDPETSLIDPNYTHEPGWSGSVVQQAGGVCYMGDFYQGFINTPEIEMAGTVHFSFRARIQPETGQSMTFVGLCTNPSNPNIIQLEEFFMTPEWTTYEFDLANPESGEAFIQINCFKEWFLDDVVITRELDFTPAPEAFDATDYTMDGFTAHWGPVANAEEYLLTVFKRDFHGPDTVYVAPESFEGINNDGQWIDYSNPNFPEGWEIKLQAGGQRQVAEGHTGSVSLCMDAEGDTIFMPSNGGRYLASNVFLRLVQYNPDTDNSRLSCIAKVNGVWVNTGVYIPDNNVYPTFGYDWIDDDLFSYWLGNRYDEFGFIYEGHGAVWAIDDWDYTTSQACTIETIFEDRPVDVTELSYVVTDLNPADDHYYYVKATNAEFGDSDRSNYIGCFGLCAPVMEEASNIGTGTYTANWQAHPKANRYEIHNYYVTTAETDQQEALVFEEDFVLVHNGATPENYITDPDPEVHRLDEYTVQPDWMGAAVILAEGMVGGATTNYYYGQIMTPEITLDNAETFKVKITVWCTGGDDLWVTVRTTGEVQEHHFMDTGIETFEMEFAAGPDSGRERLRIRTKYGYPFLVDAIRVFQDQHAGDKTYNIWNWDVIDDGTADSYTFTGLDGIAWEDFAYDIKAFHTAFGNEYESANSEHVDVTVPLDVEENADESKVSVYPNPANDKFVVAGDAATIEIFDMTGRCVKSVQASALLTSVSTTTFADGLYLLKVTAKDGSVTNQRIVVEH